MTPYFKEQLGLPGVEEVDALSRAATEARIAAGLRVHYPDRDLTPEHTKRNLPGATTPHPDILAAYGYVDSVLDTSDYEDKYAWHGWALREAFLAGMSRAAHPAPVPAPAVPASAAQFVEWMKAQPEDREPTTIDGALAEFERHAAISAAPKPEAGGAA